MTFLQLTQGNSVTHGSFVKKKKILLKEEEARSSQILEGGQGSGEGLTDAVL